MRRLRTQVFSDANGAHFLVPQDGTEFPCIDCWWAREPRKRKQGRTVLNEYFVIRQENGEARADVIVLSPGQVYDLIEALNIAVERT